MAQREKTNLGKSVEPLEYKENWPKVRERMLAFWEREIIDRACIAVTAPREKQVPVPEADAEREITDIDLHFKRYRALFQNTYYGGEALPVATTILGLAALGGTPRFMKDEQDFYNTVWVYPSIKDWTSPYSFDPQNKWCQRYLDLKRRDAIESQGKWLTLGGGVLPPTDSLMQLRGPEGLCLDMLDHPQEVAEALSELLEAYKWINRQVFQFNRVEEEGAVSLRLWAPGTNVGLSCDFSCMVSPELYRKFILPEMEEITNWVDYSFYHLDGPNALQHVPALLELPKLNGIQWQPGWASSTTPAVHWLPLHQSVQAAGRCVQMHAKYDEVEALLQGLDPGGVLIVTTAPSVEAADALLRNAEKWSCRGVHPVPAIGKAPIE